MQHVFKNLSDFFQPFTPSDSVVLALSGGPDSVFLGELLHRAHFQKVVVAHFNHGLRGVNSENDQYFCFQKAQEWQWEFVSETWKNPKSSEEQARRVRYEFLERTRKKHKAKAIFLAHQQEDQVETIFFQFLRGTGIKGLLGMTRWDEDRKLFRPLLGFSKEQILNFLKQENTAFRTDETNFDPETFDRNFLRLQVFPLLQKRFPYFGTALLRNADLFRTMQDFIAAEVQRTARELMENDVGKNRHFSRNRFFLLAPFLRGEILRWFFAPTVPTALQIKQIAEFLHEAKSGKEKALLGIRFRVYGENIFIEKIKE